MALGYVVIWDPSMSRLSDFEPQVIDAPFHPEYEQFLVSVALDIFGSMIAHNFGLGDTRPKLVGYALPGPVVSARFCKFHGRLLYI